MFRVEPRKFVRTISYILTLTGLLAPQPTDHSAAEDPTVAD